MRTKQMTRSLVITLLAFNLAACQAGDGEDTLKTASSNDSAIPQIQFKVEALNASFTVDLPTIDLENSCAAVEPINHACLLISFTDNTTLTLEGAVGQNDNAADDGCATADLQAEVNAPIDEKEIATVDFKMLLEADDCEEALSITQGGASVGQSELMNTTVNDTTTAYALRFYLDGQPNLYEINKGGRAYHTTTMLDTGELLIVGGINQAGTAVSETLITKDGKTFQTEQNLNFPRFGHTATRVDQGPLAGSVIIAGGYDPQGSAVEVLEIYNPNCDPDTTPGNCQFMETLSFAVLGNPPTVTTVAFSLPRFGHQATLVSTENKIIFTGGRDATLGAGAHLLPATEAYYTFDLQTLRLEKFAPPESDLPGMLTGADGITSHVAFAAPVGNFGDALFLYTGLRGLDAQAADYVTGGLAYIFEEQPFWFKLPATLAEGEQRSRATAVKLSNARMAIIGGFYIDSAHDSILTFSLDPADLGSDIIQQLDASLSNGRFSVVAEEIEANSANYLLSGGGEVDAVNAAVTTASDELEVLIGDSQCIRPFQAIDLATKALVPKSMVTRRIGHSVNMLDGNIFIFGGSTEVEPQETIPSTSGILDSYTIIPEPELPNTCLP